MIDTKQLRQAISAFDQGIAALEKNAFVPAPPPQGPAAGGPPPGAPMDPAMGGMPVDPNTGMPIDPNTGMPIDPAMMQGGAPMPPPPGAAPAGPPPGPQGGGLSPEIEKMLSDMANGIQGVVDTATNQQQIIDTMSQRLLDLETKMNEMTQALDGPAPFEGSTKTQATAGEEPSSLVGPPLPPPGA